MSSFDSVETVERILSFTFPVLLNEYGFAEIVLLVEKYLPKIGSAVRAAVQSFFADEGYTLGISSATQLILGNGVMRYVK